MKKIITITDEQKGMRLDRVVLEHLSSFSRSSVQKMIKDGFITVNEKKVIPHHFLKSGDKIGLSVSSVIPSNSESQKKYFPHIVVETSEYLIIDKPAGMVVHAGIKREHGTLVDWILENYPEIKKVGSDPLRPGIVHRLDKDASGVMVVARTQNSFESLVRQFKLREVKKQYLILVVGSVIPKEGVIDFPISRSKSQYTKRAAGSKEGVPAVTRYSVEKIMKHVSLVRVMPETGRTHQIRVHFFAKGNPILGDTIYTNKQKASKSRQGLNTAGRLMLHAISLGFKDGQGEWREYTVAPDKDFQDVLAQEERA